MVDPAVIPMKFNEKETCSHTARKCLSYSPCTHPDKLRGCKPEWPRKVLEFSGL